MRNKEEYEKIANKIGGNMSAIDIVNSISGSRHDSKDVLQLITDIENIRKNRTISDALLKETKKEKE